jgi:predicted DNA-binding transcriptional regulator AlpA
VQVDTAGTVELMTKEEVLARLRCNHVTLWAWVKQGHFPAPIVPGPDGGSRTRLYWIKSEIDNHLANSPRRLPRGSRVTP